MPICVINFLGKFDDIVVQDGIQRLLKLLSLRGILWFGKIIQIDRPGISRCLGLCFHQQKIFEHIDFHMFSVIYSI